MPKLIFLSGLIRRILFLALLPSLLFSPSLGRAQKWVEVRSPHFVVDTDAGDKRGREVAFHFEQMRATFGQLLSKLTVNVPVPLQIVAFRKGNELSRFAPVFNGRAVEVSGFFQSSTDRDYIGLDVSLEGRWEAVFHEYGHLLLNGNYPETQPWFDEGFAEYFSTINVTSRGIEIGKPPIGTMEILQQSRWMPIADLFKVRHDAKVYNEGDRRSVFYAQSWLMMHYLQDKLKLRETGIYFELVLNQHVSVEDAIQKAFGMTPKQLGDSVDRYYRLGEGRYGIAKLPLDLASVASYDSKSLSALDSQAMLGDFALHTRDHQKEGVAMLEEVLQQQPNNAAAQRGLGFAFLHSGDFEKSAEHFEKAAALESQDPWVHYYSALLRYRRAGNLSRSPAENEASIRELRTAVRLNPQFADAFNLLGISEMQNEELEAAQRDLAAAVQLSPRNENYTANLALVYLHMRKWEEARTLLTRLQNSQDPNIASMASQNLMQVQAMQESHLTEVSHPRSLDEMTAPQWRPKPKSNDASKDSDENVQTIEADNTPVLFLKATLVQVDCSAPPSATLTLASGAKTWKMTTTDVKRLVVIGADEFSCLWHNRRVAVNYRTASSGAGTLVSVELQ